MRFCMRQIANMNGILFPSASLPLPDHGLIPAILILKKTPRSIHLSPVVLRHTYTCTCTHLALKSYVTIYESAILSVSQYTCTARPRGTERRDVARGFTPRTWLQRGTIRRRLLRHRRAARARWEMLGQIPAPCLMSRRVVRCLKLMLRIASGRWKRSD